jgi:hypothetical protein
VVVVIVVIVKVMIVIMVVIMVIVAAPNAPSQLRDGCGNQQQKNAPACAFHDLNHSGSRLRLLFELSIIDPRAITKLSKPTITRTTSAVSVKNMDRIGSG